MTLIDQLITDQKASINFFNPPNMVVQIKQLEPGQYNVNGKLIYKDMNDKWIASEELTITESKEFRKHLKTQVNG